MIAKPGAFDVATIRPETLDVLVKIQCRMGQHAAAAVLIADYVTAELVPA